MINTMPARKEDFAFQGDESRPSFAGSGYSTTTVQDPDSTRGQG